MLYFCSDDDSDDMDLLNELEDVEGEEEEGNYKIMKSIGLFIRFHLVVSFESYPLHFDVRSKTYQLL